MAFSSAYCHDLPPANSTIARFDARFWHLDFPLSAIATVVAEDAANLTVNAEFRSNRDLVGLLWTSADKYGHPLFQYLESRDYSGVKMGFVANPRNPYDFSVAMLSNGADLIYRLFPLQVSGSNLVPIPPANVEIDGEAPAMSWPVADVFPGGAPAVPAGHQIYVLDFDNLRLGFNYDGDLINPATIQQFFFPLTPADYGLGAGARVAGEGIIVGATEGSDLEGYNNVTPTENVNRIRIMGGNPNLRLAQGDIIRIVLGVPVADGGGGKTALYRIENQTIDVGIKTWSFDGIVEYADGNGGTLIGAQHSIFLPEPLEAAAWLGGGRATHVKLQKDTPLGSVAMQFNMKSISVTGTGGTLPRRNYPQPVHGMMMTSGYDDTYNITPWRQMDNTYGLGYRGHFTMYMGMSHYFTAASYGATPGDLSGTLFNNKVVKDAAQPLNAPTVAWCQSLFANMRAKGYTLVWSTSYEILNSYCPEEWKQRDYLQKPALSGWSPPSSFIIPSMLTADGPNEYLARVIKAGVALMRAAGWPEAECKFQIGEPWWWDGSYTTGAPCIYDPYTQAKYTAETGLPVPTPFIQNYKEDVVPGSAREAYLAWLGVKLGQSTNYIRDSVKAAYPTSKATLLFFTPQLFDKAQNVPGLPPEQGTGGRIRELMNFPISEWKYPNYDFMQIEDYDWIINGELHLLQETYNAATIQLEYPLSVVHYFVGFVLFKQHTWIWPNINVATKRAKANNIPFLYVWAYPQVIRDGILYDDTVLETPPAIQPPVPARRQLPATIAQALIRPVFFVQVGADMFMNSSDKNIAHDGHTWYATGKLGSLSALTEGMMDAGSGWTMTLQRLPLTDVNAIAESLRNAPVTLAIGLVGPDHELLDAPRVVAAGKVQSNNIEIKENRLAVEVVVKSPLGNFGRIVNQRYTDEGQQLRHPGDRGFKFIAELQQVQIAWGDKPTPTVPPADTSTAPTAPPPPVLGGNSIDMTGSGP